MTILDRWSVHQSHQVMTYALYKIYCVCACVFVRALETKEMFLPQEKVHDKCTVLHLPRCEHYCHQCNDVTSFFFICVLVRVKGMLGVVCSNT